MAAEISRKGGRTCVLALHPGEVETDMANVELDWVVEGVIQPRESVEGMLRVVEERGEGDNGTFWCWDGRIVSNDVAVDKGEKANI
ncbi:short-chain dehydrogenase [Aspergillus luchuensis]|uniref:Short-chain dehydrogenase n=1 Tax=Aspergillus kawachii TaxID=1069201 RepID=A0A146FG69_ASPKA|nr:short-chain dehydrogenase [Aspergillus luchuensis]